MSAKSTVWVKICGVKDPAQAVRIAEAGAQAIGLNFHPGSPRCVTAELAAEIARALPEGVVAVGVFVNLRAAEIAGITESVGLHAVQLHGDEPPELLAEVRKLLPGIRLIRAFRVGHDGLASMAGYLDRCRELAAMPDMCLLDALVKGMYGGSGHTLEWDRLREEYRFSEWPPLILAGGLKPANIAAAVRTVSPWGVDTASGVERAPGEKDLQQVSDFIAAARSASDGAAGEGEPVA